MFLGLPLFVENMTKKSKDSRQRHDEFSNQDRTNRRLVRSKYTVIKKVINGGSTFIQLASCFRFPFKFPGSDDLLVCFNSCFPLLLWLVIMFNNYWSLSQKIERIYPAWILRNLMSSSARWKTCTNMVSLSLSWSRICQSLYRKKGHVNIVSMTGVWWYWTR